MFIKSRISDIAFAVALTVVAPLSFSQTSAPLKPQKAPSGVSYVSGGIGDAQQKAMREAMHGYTLRLTFARPKSGDYLSDVKVRIDQEGKDGNGKPVLDVTSTGPMLFAKLPDGAYRVRAEYGGQVQSKTVSIGHEEPRELVYYFAEK